VDLAARLVSIVNAASGSIAYEHKHAAIEAALAEAGRASRDSPASTHGSERSHSVRLLAQPVQAILQHCQ